MGLFDETLADVFDDGPGAEKLEGELADTAPSGGGMFGDILNAISDTPTEATEPSGTQSADMDDVVGAAVNAVNNADDTAPSRGGIWDDALNAINDSPDYTTASPTDEPAADMGFVAPPPSDIGFDTAPSPEPDYSYDDGSGSGSPIDVEY